MSEQERQDDLELLGRLRAGQRPGLPSGPCPDELELASYMDGRSSDARVRAVEAHLAGCPACLEMVLEVRRLLGRPATLAPAHVIRRAGELVSPASVRPAAMVGPALRIWRAAQWAAAAVLAIAVSYAGFSLGQSTWRGTQAQRDLVAREASFGLNRHDPALTGEDLLWLAEPSTEVLP